MTNHLFIPDCQVKEGVPLEHLSWIGQYIVDKKPDHIILAGDFADMPSLSSYDKGKRCFEGRRYVKDIDAARLGMDLLLAPMKEYNTKQKATKHAQYKPNMDLTLGNHEYRIERAVEAQPELEGVIGYEDLPYEDWIVHDFLKPVVIDGVMYVHYLSNPFTGRPYGGNVLNQLNKVQHSFCVGHKQTLESMPFFTPLGKQTWGIIAGACLTPDHEVLMADLTYKPLGNLHEGESIVSFDEHPGLDGKRSRRYSTGTVKAVKIDIDDIYEVTLENGKEFKVTKDHLWLTSVGSKVKWTRTDNLVARDSEIKLWNNSIPCASHVIKVMDHFKPLTSFDAGWLSGMFDGEGCLYSRQTTGGTVAQLGVSQKEGPLLDRCRRILSEELSQETLTETYDRSASTLRIKGGRIKIAEVLGQLRPTRLLSKWSPELLGRMFSGERVGVKSVKYIGKGEIVRVDVDKKTMVVDGYAHHNCYLHDEEYKGYQGNAHWRGIIMLNDVKEGVFSPWFISLDFLRKRYE